MNGPLVILTPWFGENMGYIENQLPKALASLDTETHVVTSRLQPHFNRPIYKEAYEPLNGPSIQPEGITERDGFVLHRLRHRLVGRHVLLRGLRPKLRDISPSVIQTFAAALPFTAQAALLKPILGFKLFTGAHHTASTFPLTRPDGPRGLGTRLAVFMLGTVPGRLVSFASTECHAATIDCAAIARRYYGVPGRKISLHPLGVDTQLFGPPDSPTKQEARAAHRLRLGYEPDEIVCIYTGRFGEDKSPVVLARAVSRLRRGGAPFRALFVGAGDQQAAILKESGSDVMPFMPQAELAEIYRVADIGVWPREESISMLDAAASGLPIVVSDHVEARERYEGNGRTYKEGDAADLAQVLSELADPTVRVELGAQGLQKMRDEFDWSVRAQARLDAYRGSRHEESDR